MKKKKNKPKKAYQPPRVESREIYEVNALGCDKCPSASNVSKQVQCKLGVKRFS